MKSPAIHRTPLYRAKAAYANMIRRCGNPDGLNPTYKDVELRMTLEEWLTWSVPKYEQFIKDNPGISPSVSRYGDLGHYEIGNIEITSKSLNAKEANKTRVIYYELICPVCDKEFLISRRNYVSKMKIRRNGITCSRSCGGKLSHYPF